MSIAYYAINILKVYFAFDILIAYCAIRVSKAKYAFIVFMA
jgi:hypothetical protein